MDCEACGGLVGLITSWLKSDQKKDHTLSSKRSTSLQRSHVCGTGSSASGIAEGVIHELQEQLQRVSAGHQAAHEALQSIHQELGTLRSLIDTRSRNRLGEPKSLMRERFVKKNGPDWRTWSYLARDFDGVVQAVLKQAMKNEENRKLPIAVLNLQHDFGVTNEMEQELQHFLISRTEGEALEVVRGAEREPGLEQWRRPAALYDPPAAGRSLDDSHQILFPPKASKMDDLSYTIQAWENLEQRHRERTGDQLPEDMRLAILLSMCPTDLEKELTAQEHLFPDYAQMKAHIVTIINSRTRGLASMMMGNLSDEDSNHHASSDESWKVKMENCTVWRSEMARKFSLNPDMIRARATLKVEGRVTPTKNVSAVDALVTSELTAEQRLTLMEDLRNLRPKEKVLEVARKKSQKNHKICR